MMNDIDIKSLWKGQQAPVADLSVIRKKIKRFRLRRIGEAYADRRGLCRHYAYDISHCLWSGYLDMLDTLADGHQSGHYFVVHRLYAAGFILRQTSSALLWTEN